MAKITVHVLSYSPDSGDVPTSAQIIYDCGHILTWESARMSGKEVPRSRSAVMDIPDSVKFAYAAWNAFEKKNGVWAEFVGKFCPGCEQAERVRDAKIARSTVLKERKAIASWLRERAVSNALPPSVSSEMCEVADWIEKGAHDELETPDMCCDSVTTVGDLKRVLAKLKLSDDASVLLCRSGPRSEKPCSFEDEYGPGVEVRKVRVQSGNPVAGLVIWDDGDASFPTS